MKKFLIYLTSFLFLFGVSVAFAYIEDFEDFVLDPEWFVNGEYEITAIPGGSSTGLNMNSVSDILGYSQVQTNTRELIYHFGADIYLTTSSPWADMDLFHHREDGTDILWAGIGLDLSTESFHVYAHVYDSDGQEIVRLHQVLGEYNLRTWYSLSITINDGCVTFGIDGIETNLCDELIQKPDSGFCGGRVAAPSDYVNGFVDYWVDNLVAHTLQTSSQLTVTYPNGGEVLTKGEDYTITWDSANVTGNILIHLYKGGTDPANFVESLAAGTPNDGAYPFNPPDTLSNGSDYYIGISAEGGTVWDFSDAPFTIQAAAADSDGDGIPDYQDNCTNTPNPDQTDANGDGIGDACGPQFINTYAEDFEDGDLDNPWGYAGVYQIIPDPAGSGSLVLNMTEDTGGTEVGNYFDEYVYHFEADVYIPSTHGTILGIVLWWDDLSNPSIGFRTDLKFHPDFPDIWVALSKDGTDIGSEILLDPANFDQWYKLSITYLDDHIRVGINGNEKNLFFGSYQKPDSPVQSYCSVHGSDPTLPDPVEGINWYTDNIKAFSISADPNQPPTAPALSSPPNNATDINPNNVILSWNPSTDPEGDAIEYCVTVNEDAEPNDISVFTGCDDQIFTAGTTFTLTDPLEPGKTYYWAAWAKDDQGNWSPASDWWNFTIKIADSDGDGIPDDQDVCPDTAAGDPVDANGCSDAQVDFDLDGICDPDRPSTGPSACTGIDNCPTVYNPLQTDVNDDGFGDDCVDPSVSIPDDAVIAADVIIGSGTQINKGVTVESGAVIGENVVLNKDSTVGENTEIGDNTVINQNVTIGSDVVIGENVTIGKNVTIGNGVTIGDNTVINQGTEIGDDATIGMNVVLGRDVIVEATASVADGTVVPKDTVVTP